jgi:hypothetical protein
MDTVCTYVGTSVRTYLLLYIHGEDDGLVPALAGGCISSLMDNSSFVSIYASVDQAQWGGSGVLAFPDWTKGPHCMGRVDAERRLYCVSRVGKLVVWVG